VLSVPLDPPLYVACDLDRLALGRAPDAHVRLPDPTVSLRHATLRRRGRHYLVVDEGSTNGTALLGPEGSEPVWLSADAPRVLRDGDCLRLGQVELRVCLGEQPAGSPSEDLARDLVAASLALAGHEPSDELLERALAELTEAPDEPVVRPEPPPLPALDDVVSGAGERGLTDWSLLALALLLLVLSGLGLAWILAGAPFPR
jgi:predicted component of type VI protein secretion system